MAARDLTVVVIAYREKRYNHRLLFGNPALRIRRGWRRELAAFEPGCVFGYARWTRSSYGTTEWRALVCRAAGDGPIARLPGILPGAELLLSTSGKRRTKRALAIIDQAKLAPGGAETVPTSAWRMAHNAIETGADLPALTARRMAARPC